MARIRDIRSLKELERIPNPEFLEDDALLLVEQDGEAKSIKYSDLVSGIPDMISDALIGETGPIGPTGPSGVEIVKQGYDPSEDTEIWIQEGEYPDFHKNINSYMKEFISDSEDYGDADPNEILSWRICANCGDFRYRHIDDNGNREPCPLCGNFEVLQENPLDNCMIYFQLDSSLKDGHSNIAARKEAATMADLVNQVNILFTKYADLNAKYISSKIDIDDLTIETPEEEGNE